VKPTQTWPDAMVCCECLGKEMGRSSGRPKGVEYLSGGMHVLDWALLQTSRLAHICVKGEGG
jgi:hypothetical protein